MISPYVERLIAAGVDPVEAATVVTECYTLGAKFALGVKFVRSNQSSRLSGPCSVYLLVDPAKGVPFYVGVSKQPVTRFDGHCSDVISPAYQTVRRLMREGHSRSRILKIYRRCQSREEALALESKLISTIPNLVNRERRRRHEQGQ